MFQQENQTQFKRESYGIEIRNKNRHSLFKSKRNQQNSHHFETKYLFVTQQEIQQQSGDLSPYIQQIIQSNNIPLIHETIKALNDRKLDIYPYIKGVNIIYQLSVTLNNQDEYLAYLTYFNILNLIYNLNEAEIILFYQHQHFLQLYELVRSTTFFYINQLHLDIASYGLFTLANILSEPQVYVLQPALQKQQSQFIQDILSLQNQNSTPNYVHGILWILRNLVKINQKYNDSNNIQIMDILQQLLPAIEINIKTKYIGLEIAEDFLIIIATLTRSFSDEEISQLFQTHIQLIIFIASNQWKEELYLDYALVLRNILYGQDDVIEQMLNLGISDQINTLLSNQNDIVIEETIGCISNIFCAEDEDLIILFLSQIKMPLVKEILLRSAPGNSLDLRNQSIGAINNLLKNYHQSAEIVLKSNGIQCLLSSLNELCTDQEMIQNLLGCIYALIQYDESNYQGTQMDQEGMVKLQIISYGGQELIGQYLDSADSLTSQLANNLIAAICTE